MLKLHQTISLAVVIGLLSLLAAAPAHGAFSMVSGNSTVGFDPSSQAGVFSWNVDGINQLAQQWFWYRVGPNGPESSINALSAPTVMHQPGIISDGYEIQYTGANGLSVDVKYSLVGGTAGSHASDLSEQITLTNRNTDSMSLHFFQYSDFDLNGTANDDTLVFKNANTVDQSDGGSVFSETVQTGGAGPSDHEADFFPVLLNKLNDGLPTTLNNLPGIGVPLGPGDVSWGFQWDFNIGAGNSVIISKDKNLSASAGANVPEASSWLVWGLLGLAVGGSCRALRRPPGIVA
jgi:hypothetical protein